MNLFRKGVCAVIINNNNEVLLCKTKKTQQWQFPQGGVDPYEITINALKREVLEEVGLEIKNNDIIGETKNWIPYLLKQTFLDMKPEKFEGMVGQKHKYFLVKWDGNITDLDFSNANEFTEAKWVKINYEIQQYFSDVKREAYMEALLELLVNY